MGEKSLNFDNQKSDSHHTQDWRNKLKLNILEVYNNAKNVEGKKV